jgi:tight adherence protein C
MPVMIFLAAGAVALSVPLLWWAVASSRHPGSAAAHNLGVRAERTDLRSLLLDQSAGERFRPVIQALAASTTRITPRGMLDRLEQKIARAGRPARWPLERVLAAKLILSAAILVPTGSVWVSSPSRLSASLTIAGTALFFWLPDAVLGLKAAERQKAIQRRLPDTLDQMTICVEAGLGFEGAMARAGEKGEGPLAEELVRTLQEMQVGATRAQALRGLMDRTGIPELRRFVIALLQAESYGMPIADVLRTQAAEHRDRRRQAAEERALKIPVKIAFPLILCILPSIFIVTLGPAGLRLARLFAGGSL